MEHLCFALRSKHLVYTAVPGVTQAQALPVVMSGRDCIGVAKTGSGKTLAFVLPMLRHIKASSPRRCASNHSLCVSTVLHMGRMLSHHAHVCELTRRDTVDCRTSRRCSRATARSR